MTTYRRKLIEVDLPLDEINSESAREKSIRHGHPSTLHLWWARRPLAACRAVIFASMVDDPSSYEDEFPTEAEQRAERERLHEMIKQLVKRESWIRRVGSASIGSSNTVIRKGGTVRRRRWLGPRTSLSAICRGLCSPPKGGR